MQNEDIPLEVDRTGELAGVLMAISASAPRKGVIRSVESMTPYPKMPIKATPYRHQREAFAFACRLFGLAEGGDAFPSISSCGVALLMEM